MSDVVADSWKVTSVRYEVRDVYSGGKVQVTVYWSGEQTYNYQGDSGSSECWIKYKLYDSQGYVVISGTDESADIQKGEKFKDEYFVISDLDPNESYTLELIHN